MARLFITPREIDFISDITKEVMKDIIGQKIYYFSISEVKTHVHDIYNESPEKIFENPIEVDALVQYEPQDVKTGIFGTEDMFNITAWVHTRDLLDKGIQLSEGDFFSFGDVFFEIVTYKATDIVYGQVEHGVGYEIRGKEARKSQFVSKIFGPTEEKYSDEGSVQETYVQQRGFENNRLGPTGDVRDLQKKGVLDKPITGPHEVSKKARNEGNNAGSAFYGDDSE